jgi:hypothetical protein
MIQTALAILALAVFPPSFNPSAPIEEIRQQVRSWTTAKDKAMTATLIQAPDAETVPDGTTATAANSGLEGLDETGTWETLPDGRRYIKKPAGASMTLKLLDASTIDAATHFAYQLPIQYLLAEGEDWPADDSHFFMNINSDGTQLRVLHRANPAWEGLQVQLQDFDNLEGSQVTRPNGKTVEQEEIDHGAYFFHDASGFLGYTLDGQVIEHVDGADVAAVTSMERFGWLTPIDDANIEARIIFPIKYWTDDSYQSEMVPDRSEDSAYGHKARWTDQITPTIGPFETTSGTVNYTKYATGGIRPDRQRAVASGGDATIELRDGHEFGQLQTFADGRAALVLPHSYLTSGKSARFRAGKTVVDDVIDLLFDGTSGTAGAREIKIGGVATGLTYDQADRYQLIIIFDETPGKSALILQNLSEDSNSVRRQSVVAWEGVGEIPEINKITIDLTGADAEFEGPLNPDGVDIIITSSYNCTETTISGEAPIQSKSRISNGWNAYPNPGSRRDTGIWSYNPHARSGHGLTHMVASFGGDYADFVHLRGVRLAFIEWQLNNDANINTIMGVFEPMTRAAIDAQMRILYCTAIPVPTTGDTPEYTEAFQAQQRTLNKRGKTFLERIQKNGLIEIADVARLYTNSEGVAAFYNPPADDVHFDPDGDELYPQKVVSTIKTLPGLKHAGRRRVRRSGSRRRL